ncbi:MAG: polysaccharide deacetylase family protein [Bacillota bacterium]|nr:polysaccharide deacetylase family protein [Bacillota bacterium]
MRKRAIKIIILILIVIGIAIAGHKISSSRSFQFFGGIVNKIETQEKVVALTFDDGPSSKTDEILAILEQLEVKGTFFVTGRELEQRMEEGKKIVAAGHELGNHTYTHKRMVFKSPSFIREELEFTDRLIREAGFQGDIHFRPPNGKKLVELPYILKQSNKRTIMWDLEPDSYPEIASSSDAIINHVVENVRPGSIILLHIMYDSRSESLASIEGIVTKLRAEGYSFKTVSELMEYQEK